MQRIVALFALLGLAAATCPAAELTAVRECYATYMHAFTLSLSPSLPPYMTYVATRARAMQMADDNPAATVCVWGAALSSCLSAYPCLGKDDFSQLALSSSEATEYWADLAATKYDCGAGLAMFIHEYYCLLGCRQSHTFEFNTCREAMQDSIAKGGDRCKAYAAFISCEDAQVHDCCDKVAVRFNCNSERATFLAIDDTCTSIPQCPQTETIIRADRH